MKLEFRECGKTRQGLVGCSKIVRNPIWRRLEGVIEFSPEFSGEIKCS